MRTNLRAIGLVLFFLCLLGSSASPNRCGDGLCDEVERTSGLCSADCVSGDDIVTQIWCEEVGRIAVRIDVPAEPRYGTSAPIVVVASTWFVEKYNEPETPFHLVYNPVDVGAITVSHLAGEAGPGDGHRK